MKPMKWDEEFLDCIIEEIRDGAEVTVPVYSKADEARLRHALARRGAGESWMKHLTVNVQSNLDPSSA